VIHTRITAPTNAQLFPSTLVLVQSQKLEKASELVKGKEPRGYAYALYDRQHEWLKERFPLSWIYDGIWISYSPSDQVSQHQASRREARTVIYLPWVAFLIVILWMIRQGEKGKREYLRKRAEEEHTP